MKQLFKDYWEYQKGNSALAKIYWKKHWKGTLLLNVLFIVGMVAWIFRSEIKDKVSESKSEKELTERLESEW